jgi:GcrA cell cycle regulator
MESMEDNPWTEALVAELRDLVVRQVPYATIARQLGVSRNAAIGKAKRLDIKPNGNTGVEDRSVGEERRRQTSGAGALACRQRAEGRPLPPRAFRREPIPPAISSDPLNLRMEQLKYFHCRYITNDDVRDATYCGCRTVEGTSWCAFHLARVRALVPPDEVPLAPSASSQG